MHLIYSTFDHPSSALTVGETLLAERLAACVNLLPIGISLYLQKGEIVRGSECVALFKTREALVPAAMERIRALHPYTCPAIFAIAASHVEATYDAWIVQETTL
jgi:periplasmic divalent cation tolerance protein